MKKVIICNIPMKEDVYLNKYESNDLSLPVAKKEVRYPINAFLERTVQPGDEIKALLLLKDDGEVFSERNAEFFIEEMNKACANVGVAVDYKKIVSPFSESQVIHEALLSNIVDEVEGGSHILCDITYGPKDLPIIVFTALNFLEKFASCEIDNIIYGQAFFKNRKIEKSLICDMASLYYLNSITDTIRCNNPEKAKILLKETLSL